MLVGDGSPTVTNCTFRDNFASTRGAAVYVGPTAFQLTNCAFLGNTAEDPAAMNPQPADGGAVYAGSGSTLTVVNCTFVDNTAVMGTGGGLFSFLGTTTVANCIFWDNMPDQIDSTGLTPAVTFSDVQGGGFFAPSNINELPGFVGANDVRLVASSPCIDIGNNSVVPADVLDVDGDEDVSEKLPDLGGNDRVVDGDSDKMATVIVDMGAYEFQAGAQSSCFGDIDGSGDVGFADILRVVSGWGPCAGCPEDLDGSGAVGFSDILAILTAWGSCP